VVKLLPLRTKLKVLFELFDKAPIEIPAEELQFCTEVTVELRLVKTKPDCALEINEAMKQKTKTIRKVLFFIETLF
jgi:hypothetical protein